MEILLTLSVAIFAGLMLSRLAKKLKLPAVTAYLVAGVIIGPYVLGALGIKGLGFINHADVKSYSLLSDIALGFIALALRRPEKASGEGALLASKNGALIVSTYLVQATTGLIISLALAYTFMPDFFKASGILVAMAYGQGPGQANNVGSTYEALGFLGGRSFGLSLAAAGYLVACVVGVIYMNILARKDKITRYKDADNITSGSVTVDTFQDENEGPISESVDRLSVQCALILLVYLLTFLLIWGIVSLLEAVAPGVANMVSTLLWGFNFIVGSLVAFLFRVVFKNLKRFKLMNRQYQNNYLLSRLSGVAFDFMIVAGIASIDISDLSGNWVPFLLMAVLGGVTTFLYLKWLCKKLYPNYFYEGFFSMFGMLTGTISSGVLLLREIDPELKTPASNNLITGSSFGILFGIPMLLLISFAAKSESSVWIALALILVYLAALLAFILKAKSKREK